MRSCDIKTKVVVECLVVFVEILNLLLKYFSILMLRFCLLEENLFSISRGNSDHRIFLL